MTTSPTTLFGPFTIDTTGRVFRNGERVEPWTLREAERKALREATAPTRQNRAQVAERAGARHELPPLTVLRHRDPVPPRPAELVAVLFYVAVRVGSSGPSIRQQHGLTPPNWIEREEWILPEGDVGTGWQRLSDESTTWLFHGPSLALHIASEERLARLKQRLPPRAKGNCIAFLTKETGET